MIKHVVGLLLIVLSAACSPAEVGPRPMQQCMNEAVFGFPVAKKTDTAKLCRKGYALEHDNKAKIPIWVAYVLTPIEATGCGKRDNDYTPDVHLRVNARSAPKDYARSGYDQGHIANSADFLWDNIAQAEAGLMSNMTPQLPQFNRGIWKKLEDSTRGWVVNRRRPLQIYAGPVYDRARNPVIGFNLVTVPHGFWKVIIDPQSREVMAFAFRHEESKRDLSQHLISLAELQKISGLILPVPKNPIYLTQPWPRIVKSIGRQKTAVCSLRL